MSLSIQISLGTTDLVGVHDSTCSWLMMCIYEMVVYELKSLTCEFVYLSNSAYSIGKPFF